MEERKSIAAIVAFNLTYLLVATFFAFKIANWEFVFYISVIVLLTALVIAVHHTVGLTMTTLWCLSVWGLLHMIGGLMPLPADWLFDGHKAVFYSWWIIPDLLKYDQVVHAFGFGTCTWICWQVWRMKVPHIRASYGVLFLCVTMGMGLGALNEVVEFIAVLTIPDTNVGGYFNTAWDLVANAVGCIVAAATIRFYHHAG